MTSDVPGRCLLPTPLGAVLLRPLPAPLLPTIDTPNPNPSLEKGNTRGRTGTGAHALSLRPALGMARVMHHTIQSSNNPVEHRYHHPTLYLRRRCRGTERRPMTARGSECTYPPSPSSHLDGGRVPPPHGRTELCSGKSRAPGLNLSWVPVPHGASVSDVAASIGDKVPRAPSPVHGTYQDSYKQWLSLLSGGSSSGPGALH